MEPTSFIIRDIDVNRNGDEAVIVGLTSENEVLQYLIDHWGDNNFVTRRLRDMGCYAMSADTPYRMKAIIDFTQFVIARVDNARPGCPIIVADRTTLGRATTATILRWETERQERESYHEDGTLRGYDSDGSPPLVPCGEMN